MLNLLPYYMVRSLAATLIIELVFAAILGARNKKDLLNVALVNIMTNPVVVSVSFVTGFFYGQNARLIVLIILELFALFSEGFIYKKTLNYKKINPFLFSLLLNGASYGIGLIINKIF